MFTGPHFFFLPLTVHGFELCCCRMNVRPYSVHGRALISPYLMFVNVCKAALQ